MTQPSTGIFQTFLGEQDPKLLERVMRGGATKEEIAETIGVAFWLGGMHALSTASEALRK